MHKWRRPVKKTQEGR
jgi:hypothetical protein